MLREGSFALASLGKVRKVHETAFAVAFGHKSVALKRILDATFESPSSPDEATFADLMDVLLAIALPTGSGTPMRLNWRTKGNRCTSFSSNSGIPAWRRPIGTSGT